MAKPIRVRLKRAIGDWPKGAELGFDSEAAATKELGDADAYTVTMYADTSEYVAPEPAAASEPAADEPKAKKG